MAILIPSKNIYEVNNQKVRTNAVDNISIEQTIVTPNNEYNVVISDFSGNGIYQFEADIKSEIDYKSSSSGGQIPKMSYTLNATYLSVSIGYSKVDIVKFERLLENKYIQSIYSGKDTEGNAQIKRSIYYTVIEEEIERDYKNIYQDFLDKGKSNLLSGQFVEERILSTNESSIVNAIPSEYIKDNGEIVVTESPSEGFTTTIKFTNKDNISSVKDDSNSEYGIFNNLILLTAMETTKLNRYFFVPSSLTSTPPIGGNDILTLKGKRINYSPNKYEITFYGDTIGIDLTDGTITYGSGNKPLSLERNELLQDSAKVGNSLLTEHLADNVLTQYKNGKETAELLCDINDYKDYESDKVAISASGKPHYPIENITFSDRTITIPSPLYNDLKVEAWTFFPSGQSTETITIKGGETSGVADYGIMELISAEIQTEMIFRIHDKVIPMVFGANGQDRPMSNYKDGSPKVFEVVGTEMIYDGAVWQKLTLLEKKQEIT